MSKSFRDGGKGGRNNQQGRDRRQGDWVLNEETLDLGPGIALGNNDVQCGDCRVNPALIMTITYERNGEIVTDRKPFYKGDPKDGVRLCMDCATEMTDGVVDRNLFELNKSLASAISVLTGNNLAGHAYLTFGSNANEVMEQVDAGEDIVQVVSKLLREQAEAQDDRHQQARRVNIPADEELVTEAIEVALQFKDGQLGEVTDLIGERLSEIEAHYVNLRPDIVLTEARRMKVDGNLLLAETLIAATEEKATPFRQSPDGTAIFRSLHDLRSACDVCRKVPRGLRPAMSDFEIFQKTRDLYLQSLQIQESQERREELQKRYTGRFSGAFRRQPTVASPESPTLGDDPAVKAALEAVNNADDPTQVPEGLKADADQDEGGDEQTDDGVPSEDDEIEARQPI